MALKLIVRKETTSEKNIFSDICKLVRNLNPDDRNFQTGYKRNKIQICLNVIEKCLSVIKCLIHI